MSNIGSVFVNPSKTASEVMVVQVNRFGKRLPMMASVFALGALLAACGGPYPDMSNYDLQEALWKCKSVGDGEMTPGMGVKCGNIKRECEVRRKAGRISTC